MVLIHFSDDLILVSHMLMSGSWHIYRDGERSRLPRNRMRAVIQTAEWEAVAFNVPALELLTHRSLARSQIAQLGPDLFSKDFAPEDAVARLQAYAKASPYSDVATALLNQRVLSGLGNVYKSEVAFAMNIHPFRN